MSETTCGWCSCSAQTHSPGHSDVTGTPSDLLPCGLGLKLLLLLLSPRLQLSQLSYTWNLNSAGRLVYCSRLKLTADRRWADGLWAEPIDNRQSSFLWTLGTCLCVYCVLCLCFRSDSGLCRPAPVSASLWTFFCTLQPSYSCFSFLCIKVLKS